jgi:hypothetical protein
VCNGSGTCELTCQQGLLACGGTCIDPDTDRMHCGASGDCAGANAGTACGAGQICNGSGACELSCQAGLIACNGTCIDPDTDRAHCGATADCQGANAGTACDAGEICNGSGVCELSCQAGLVACNGTCIDPDTDVTYCGASGDCMGVNDGTTCAANEGCSAGVCRRFEGSFSNVTFPIAVPTSTFGLGQLELGFGGDLFAAGAGTKDIFRISRIDGSATTFATDVITSTYQMSLVFDPGTNALYAGSDGGAMVKVSAAGVATSFTTVSGQLNSMTMAPAGFGTYGGQILVGTTTGLYAVNQNAVPPTVTTISTAVGQISDLVFGGTTLYIVSNATDVRTITAAGVTAAVGTVPSSNLDGIEFDGKRNVLYLADSLTDALWSMTLAGTPTNLGGYDFDSGFFISGLLLVNPDLLLIGTGESNLTIRSRALP